LSFFALGLPAGSDGLPLSVKGYCTLTVEVSSAPHGVLVTSEGEHGKWNWDGQVDADLTSLDFVLELASSVAILGEDGCTVTPGVGINEVNSFLSGVNANDIHNGAEDLLIVASHTNLAVINDGGTNPVALRVAFNSRVTAIQK
jgi:hypothetical protein